MIQLWTIARFMISVPAGAPSQPEVTAITKDSVSLSWEKPKDDGGGKIEGYIVEVCPENGDWSEATPVPVKDTNVTIPRLKEGQKYQFRVKAVNKAGPGTPSRPTSPVVVETQPGLYIYIILLQIYYSHYIPY